MRSMCRTVLVVLATVCALSAVAASSAFASSEWVAKKGGVFNRLTSALAVKATTNLVLTDTGWAGGVGLSCEGKMEGTIEPGGLGKINSYTVSFCKSSGKTSCGVGTGEPVNLPWKTELYKEGGVFRVRLVSGGSGTPGWRFSCSGEEDECKLNTSASLSNNEASGGVIAQFVNGESARTTCSRGGAGAGQLEKEIKFAHPEGVEAIRVAEVTAGEWLQGGVPLSKSVATTWKGTLKLTDQKGGIFGESIAAECVDTGEGAAEIGGLGTETKWTASNCVTKAGICPSPTVEAVDLPWNTALIRIGAIATHDAISEAGKGTPGYKLHCEGIWNDTCTGTFDTVMENVTGGVDATFDGEKLKCEKGGAGQGAVEGTQLITATKGGKLEVK